MPGSIPSHAMDQIVGPRIRMRPATVDDVDHLVAIRSTPQVYARWGGELPSDVVDAIGDPNLHHLVIEDEDAAIIGAIQWTEEPDPDYRHASIDIYIDPRVHRRGYGTESLRALVDHLTSSLGHHRITIDPAADNSAAIAMYRSVGFEPVGVMRRYERGPDGTWHDGLLMEYLAPHPDG